MSTITEKAHGLNQAELFGGWSRDDLRYVAARIRRKAVPAGRMVVHRGDPGTSAFLIRRGDAAVVLTNDEGAEYTVATLGCGEVFGEMAVLTGEPRSASVKAVSDLDLIEIDQDKFQEIVLRRPELNARLLRLLSKRLGRTNVEREADHRETREVISDLLACRQSPLFETYPGVTQSAAEVNAAIERVAVDHRHVLVLGEAGTGKELVAQLIHHRSGGPRRPLFTLDCANPPPVLRETRPCDADEAVDTLTEFAQEAALFGHRAGCTALAVGNRKGHLELGDEGTLLLKNVEYLGHRVQRALLAFLEHGTFRRMGERETRRSRVRVVACSSRMLEDIRANGRVDADLLGALSVEVIQLKPLRERRQDIPPIAESLLKHYAAQGRSNAVRFSRDAMHALVDHDWALNIDGMRHVVEGAVAVCPGAEVTEEHILLDIVPFEAKGSVNLLKFGWARRLASKRAALDVVRIALVPALIAMILYTLFGPERENLGNMLLWTIGWPLLLIVTVIGARGWCGVCPMPPISHAIGRLTASVASPPRWLRRQGLWIGVAGVVLIVWVEWATRMPEHPRATGVLLAVILAAATLSALAFGKRVWCRYLCPLGQIVVQYAAASPTQVRGNSNVCLTQCHTYDCVRDNNCPMNVHPSAGAAAHDCVLCLSCIKSCTHDAVRLEVRPPWYRLLGKKWELPRAILPLALIATVLSLKLSAWSGLGEGAGDATLGAMPGVTLRGILAFGFFAIAYMGGVVAASAWAGRGRLQATLASIGRAYMPLALAAYFNLHFREFLSNGEGIVPRMAAAARLDGLVRPEWITPELGTLKALLPIITLISAAAGLWLLTRLSDRCHLAKASLRSHQVIMTLTALLLIRFL